MNAQALAMPLAREREERWSLRRTPNYELARELESVEAADIDEAAFRRDYLMQNRPCCFRSAIKHWPAYRHWDSRAYLESKTPNIPMEARTLPMVEYVGAADVAIRDELIRYNRDILVELPLHEFFRRARDEAQQLVLHSVVLGEDGLGTLHRDLGTFPFMKTLSAPRVYSPYRAFFYRHSYTDWHYHATDEAFMTQVVGRKEVLLLPPDQASWDALWPVACQNGAMFDVDTARFPRMREIRPLRVVVEAGDALYIPAYWWHAVESIDDRFGATVAATFKTPLHVNGDLRFPATRRFVERYGWSRHTPFVLAALASSAWRRMTRP